MGALGVTEWVRLRRGNPTNWVDLSGEQVAADCDNFYKKEGFWNSFISKGVDCRNDLLRLIYRLTQELQKRIEEQLADRLGLPLGDPFLSKGDPRNKMTVWSHVEEFRTKQKNLMHALNYFLCKQCPDRLPYRVFEYASMKMPLPARAKSLEPHVTPPTWVLVTDEPLGEFMIDKMPQLQAAPEPPFPYGHGNLIPSGSNDPSAIWILVGILSPYVVGMCFALGGTTVHSSVTVTGHIGRMCASNPQLCISVMRTIWQP